MTVHTLPGTGSGEVSPYQRQSRMAKLPRQRSAHPALLQNLRLVALIALLTASLTEFFFLLRHPEAEFSGIERDPLSAVRLGV